MNINWYGQNCFRINSPKGKNGPVSILIDPPSKESGFRGPRVEGDILMITDPNRKGVNSLVGKETFLVAGPGEYDVKGVYIEGINRCPEGEKRNTIYTIELEDMKLCHLGNLAGQELRPEQLNEINEVNILMIPIGGGEVIDSKVATKIMSQIEPEVIIPMHYSIPKLKMKMDGVDKFLKALGIKSLKPLPKLSIKKSDLSKEMAKIIVLQP